MNNDLYSKKYMADENKEMNLIKSGKFFAILPFLSFVLLNFFDLLPFSATITFIVSNESLSSALDSFSILFFVLFTLWFCCGRTSTGTCFTEIRFLDILANIKNLFKN